MIRLSTAVYLTQNFGSFSRGVYVTSNFTYIILLYFIYYDIISVGSMDPINYVFQNLVVLSLVFFDKMPVAILTERNVHVHPTKKLN